jgi:hypothetical protein
MMTEIFAQGNLLLERVRDVSPSGTVSQNEGTAMLLSEGEASDSLPCDTERATCFRDDSVPRER